MKELGVMAVRLSRKKQYFALKNKMTEMNILQKERALFLSSQGKKKNQLFLHIINHLLVRGDKTEPVSTSWQSRVWLLCFKLC